MTQLISPTANESGSMFTVHLTSLNLTQEQFQQICNDNPDLRLELTSTGDLTIMPPAGSATGIRNSHLTAQLVDWARNDRTGIAFDSSAGFTLPNGAIRSPDASWVLKTRWETLLEKEKESFAPLCPDFVIELRSPGQNLPVLVGKMREYMKNGARMGWLVDPIAKQVQIFRSVYEPEVLDNPVSLSGDPVLTGFVLDLREVW
ncbi:MAG TPA: Uma2 family endonuclease [Pyrinomonadaceae bacterium]|jgi:Uma2 family endonuclease